MLGYDNTRKRFMIFITSQNKVVVHRDATFDEQVFPLVFPKQNLSPKKSQGSSILTNGKGWHSPLSKNIHKNNHLDFKLSFLSYEVCPSSTLQFFLLLPQLFMSQFSNKSFSIHLSFFYVEHLRRSGSSSNIFI